MDYKKCTINPTGTKLDFLLYNYLIMSF